MKHLRYRRAGDGGMVAGLAKQAEHLQAIGRFDDALEAYREALTRDPDNADLLGRFALCQMSSGIERSLAVETIERAIALTPDEPINHALKSLILSETDHSRDAVEPARRAIALDPSDPIGHAALSQAYLKQENWALAEQAATTALTLDPEHTISSNLLAKALYRQGKRAESALHLAGMLARDPEDPETHYSAGLLALQDNDARRAEIHFLEALRLDPNLACARDGLVKTLSSRSLFRHLSRWHENIAPRQAYFLVALGALTLAALFLWAPLALRNVGLTVMVWLLIAPSLATLMLLRNRKMRIALDVNTMRNALVAGGAGLIGSFAMLLGTIASHMTLQTIGQGFLFSAPALALVFRNAPVLHERTVSVGLIAAIIIGHVVQLFAPIWPVLMGFAAPLYGLACLSFFLSSICLLAQSASVRQ